MPAASAEPGSQPTDATSTSEHYINYVAPRIQDESEDQAKVRRRQARRQDADPVQEAMDYDAKHSQGNPVTARQLAKLEAQAIKTGKSPKEIKANRYKDAKETTEAKLLTILVEFNDQANDDFSGTMVPESVFGSRECVPGDDAVNGPLHNNIPDPAQAPAPQEDNNSLWVEDFSSQFYNQMLYTDRGITERVRKDLTGPDGKPGIDISGYTMKNMYEEMSQGAYTVTGEATPWVEVDHSEAWYGANTCAQVEDEETGELVWDAGPPQGMQGHPENPLGPGALAIDAVEKLAETNPDFPWEQYDVEDQGDTDGDGNLHEPNGVIDHVVLVHAGEDKSGGGGAQGPYAIWAHSSAVTGGADIPGTDLQISNYIVQPEDSGVGVFAHEYGHDLGLPDLYDTSGAADSDIDFWDLMSSGSHSGPIFQSMPTHMGLWDKWVLGWADPVQLNPGDDRRTVKVGQNSRPLKGSEDGVIVNLPDKKVTLAEPHSGENMWWTGSDQAWADNKIARTVDVPAGDDVRFWMWNNYVIEADWDYGFVEVSTDGGSTWEEQKVFDAAGEEVTTPDDYQDPNGRMGDFGGKKYGLEGSTEGWRHDYVDLTPYAGQTVQLRLRMATDAAFQERGWFADDFAVTADGTEVWSDDVESGANGWTEQHGTWTDTSGDGWRIDTGTHINAQFYLAEWRNFDGFDEGLKYAYDTTYSADAWKVEKIRYNAPGMLVWFRDTTYGSGMDVTNHVTSNTTSLPSEGSKGGLLIVDSHFDPLRRTGEAAQLDPDDVLDNLPSRPQSSNAAFGLQPTYEFTECLADAAFNEYCTELGPQKPVRTFTDAKGWYPGIEVREEGLFYRDIDASVVVPSRNNEPYSTRVVDAEGNPMTDWYGVDLGLATPLGSGNPEDDGVAYGTELSVKKAMKGNRAALIRVTPPRAQ
ncbi:MAG TPA: immune inhibitor A domain-containing protein [Nocardioidaceae bacterium]|nr:immune inhibitor A domain-containing protein [Nocardioidaceae bacterium]